MIEEAVLEPKLVNKIKGKFYIPAYQRGYRWEKEHVQMLLNDIWENKDQNYSLQPVVVKKIGDDTFELIDGQQRTTTLYLILKFMKQVLPFIELNFSLTYETRKKSETFLETIDESLKDDNIDFYHIYHAYQAIEEWFNDEREDKNLKVINLYKYFGERVKVIWYEVDNKADSTNLFTRLNIGKIPLTNAELVKALFLSKDNGITYEKQLEISTTWDSIEKELQNNKLWYFLTNQSPNQFATRIELIFNLMAKKKVEEKETFFTFYYFIEQIKSEGSSLEVWENIQSYFLILKEWFEKRTIYHKVGYLIAIGKSLEEIITESQGKTKRQFENDLDQSIKDKLNLTKSDVLELSYENSKDKYKIERLLLLHNVETIRLLKDTSQFYSFDNHKRNKWSLEHIHAQQSVGLNKKEDQQEWLRLHKLSLESLALKSEEPEIVNTLINEIDTNLENITKVMFDDIFHRVFNLLSEDEDRSYIDAISNMALLSSVNNSALNNATFDVKRNKVIEIDKKGAYIPICTKRVFFKYYTESKDHQLQFWGAKDREAYVDSMIGENGNLLNYLKAE
jgi:uncharacterized protein with ParB-like and HNH nuclease domain